jgi:hypothetical protein
MLTQNTQAERLTKERRYCNYFPKRLATLKSVMDFLRTFYGTKSG